MSEFGWRPGRVESAEEAKRRLDAILTDSVLRFNPYRVSSEDLVACAERGYLRPFPALTQMAIFHFLDIRSVTTHYSFDAIFYRIGNSDREYFFPLGHLVYSIAHHTSKLPLRSQVNGKNITRSNIERLQNRSFFVSHAIPGCSYMYPDRLAYQMFRLRGSVENQASIIRQQMCLAKIAMLEEVLNYPSSPCYLGYAGDDFDFATPLRSAIQTIQQFPFSCV